jgi:hypothetical protein
MRKDPSASLNSRAFFVAGWALISIGVACNEWTLTKAFSPDGVLEPITRLEIWILTITSTFTGWLLIRYKECNNAIEIFRRISHSHPRILASWIGITLAGMMWVCAEGTFYILNSYKKTNIYIERSKQEYILPDEVLGYKPWPGAQYSARKKRDGKILYDVTYSIDEYGRRTTPVKNPKSRDNFLLFFGCSVTFGEGVNGDETMPFYVAELAPKYKSYNYGYIGYGPQNMLAQLQTGNLAKEMSETDGIAIYTFIGHHVSRAIGSMKIATAWGSSLPFYTIDSRDKVVRKGSLTSGRPFLSFLYSTISKSEIVRYFNIDFPWKINDSHIKITFRLIEESRNRFRQQFHSDDFYVLLYPGSENAKEMIAYFQRAQIKYLDYSNLVELTTTEFHIKGDGHPTAKGHKTIAEMLTRDLGILGDNPPRTRTLTH